MEYSRNERGDDDDKNRKKSCREKHERCPEQWNTSAQRVEQQGAAVVQAENTSERRKGEEEFVCLPIRVDSCICQRACELRTCWASVWHRRELTWFTGQGDGRPPPCRCPHVVLGARLWEPDNKIWAPLGQSLWKWTWAVKSGMLPAVTTLWRITSQNLRSWWGWERFIILLHLICYFITGFLAAFYHLVCVMHAKEWRHAGERERKGEK